MKQRTKALIIIPAIAAAVALIALVVLFALNKYNIKMNIPENQTIVLQYGQSFEEPVVSAIYEGSIIKWNSQQAAVIKEGAVIDSELGTYEIIYTASYKDIEQKAKLTVIVEDSQAPVIELISDPEVFTSPVGQYQEEGFTATDNYDGDLTDKVVRTEENGIVTYTVEDSSGNSTTVTREIVYKDAVAPQLNLVGEQSMIWEIGTDYVDPGCTAEDDCDGDITEKVTASGSVNGQVKGQYQVKYEVSDSSGNSTEVTRNVTVADTKAPVVKLSGDTKMYIVKGQTYNEPGYSAWDAYEGDCTSKVTVSGTVNTGQIGVYTVKYSAQDSAGNAGSVYRTVYVYEKQADADSVNPGSKVVYLTFDDGPGPYTEQLLDILDKYNIKATFFVTNQKPSYQYIIGEEYRRGHTVAVHTYCHNYSTIYSSDEAYFSDLFKMAQIVEAQTGVAPFLIRFPGGSSNEVSISYSKGIMSRLVEAVGKMGYLYCDWNVSSGDGGGNIGTEQVRNNVINGIQKHDVSVVLQHDIHQFSVNAVEDIIVWGLANGYTFLPMDATTPMVHHTVAN